jgi:hypothetical protein
MHRSGTSCLTGSLQQQGLFLGEHNTAAPRNARGSRENPRVQRLHDDILIKNRGSWRKPPPSVRWRPEHFEAARELLREHAGHAVWGFKDPRTLLVYDGWRLLVPDVEQIGIFRHPLKVAKSLRERPSASPVELKDGLALWKAYNERLLELRSANRFPLVCFDDEAAVLEDKLRQAGEMLGLETQPDSPGSPFFSEELRHVQAEGPPLAPELLALYDKLRDLAV